VQRFQYFVRLDRTQRPVEMRYAISLLNDTNPPLLLHTTIAADSVRLTRTQGARSATHAAPSVDAAILPENLYTWALYELMTRASMAESGDSVSLWMVSPGGPKPYPKVVNRRASDTLSTMFFYPAYWTSFAVDRTGRLLGVDATHTTIKVLVTRHADAPLDAFAAGAVARERATGAVGDLSKPDSISSSVGSARVAVAYSRPARRGRVIWGGVVPWGEVWRTGANSATRLHLSHDSEIGGALVRAGSYTLFTLPADGGLTLIINKQVGQWGTEYNPGQDLVRIPMNRESLPASVELFTIAVVGDTTDRRLQMEWDEVRWWLPIRLRL
jgi:hypothetical protein